MKTYTQKEHEAIAKISKELKKLDDNLKVIDSIEEDTGKLHRLQRWNADRDTIHEIKEIMHEINKYDKDEYKKENDLADSYYSKDLDRTEVDPYIETVDPYGNRII